MPSRLPPVIDQKTLTAVSISLSLFYIQTNALLLLLERHPQIETIREDLQQSVSEGCKQWNALRTEFGTSNSVQPVQKWNGALWPDARSLSGNLQLGPAPV